MPKSPRTVAVRRLVTMVAAVCCAALVSPGSPTASGEGEPPLRAQGAAHQSYDGAGGGACPTCGPTETTGPLPAPVEAKTVPTGGDGFTPILYRPAAGTVEVWNIYHHGETALEAPKIACSDATTGQPCPGGPWPKPLNIPPGPLGSGQTGNISSATAPQYVFDPAQHNVLYYPAITADAVGVGCVDLATRSNCGFIALEQTGGAKSSVNAIGGLVASGGNLYGVATTGQVLCMVMATRTACDGQPYAPVVAANHDRPGPGRSGYFGAMAVADGKVFLTSSPQSGASTTDGPPVVGCFDPARATACDGWSRPKAVGKDAGFWTFSAFPAYDSGKATGVCAGASGPARVTFTCFGSDGSSLVTPSGLDSVTPNAAWVYQFNPETITAPNGELHSYFPFWGGGFNGVTSCYDWTHTRPCEGFPQPAAHPQVNGGDTRDYGYTYDATTQCLLGLGDARWLFSENPVTGAAPCLRSGASVALDLSPFRCPGEDNGQKYTRARLENVNLAAIDLAASTVTISDPKGVVARPAFAADGTIDLTGVSSAQHPAITVTVHLVLRNGDDFSDGHRPLLRVASHGEPSTVCCVNP